MTISIITPSYGQVDWLRLCIASVADQVGGKGRDSEFRIQRSEAGRFRKTSFYDASSSNNALLDNLGCYLFGSSW